MRISDWSSDVCSSDLLQADETRNRQIVERIPAGRWGDPADIGGAAVFLASKASDYVQGHILAVDGGRSEEHTSELQSLMRISYAVFCLKKNNTQISAD